MHHDADLVRNTINTIWAEEVPVAVVFNGTSVAVMMMTPVDIQDFAYGFAITEGFIQNIDEVISFEIVEHENGFEARFWLNSDGGEAILSRSREMIGPVGCGLCGIDSLDQAMRKIPALPENYDLKLSYECVQGATTGLRSKQPMHDKTHAMHAAAFITPDKEIIMVREDVGRHNALDKLIGALAQSKTSFGLGAFVLTSRVSIELVQKSAVVKCPIIIAVSAPTAQAVYLASDCNITLVTNACRDGINIVTHPQRIR